MLGGIDENDAVLIEEPVITFDENLVLLLVLEGGPRGAVGEKVCTHAHSCVDCGAHTGAYLAIPIAGRGIDIDAGCFP